MSDPLRSRRGAVTAERESTQAEVLAALALSRARLLSPVLFGAMLVWSIVIQASEHPTPTSSLVNFATCALAGVAAVASRRITDARWGHALCALLWCAPVTSSLFS
ncbi:MAG TPA: hypothetical protein VK607_07920, partial [Kofleriaceae bacterium]|nr:hypothetical protein [Kofleriaceae bacterium]